MWAPDGTLLAHLDTSISVPPLPPPKQRGNKRKLGPPPASASAIKCRGCGFFDGDGSGGESGEGGGSRVFTVQSAARGPAYVSCWTTGVKAADGGAVGATLHGLSRVSKCPVSAYAAAPNGSLLAVGNVDGRVAVLGFERTGAGFRATVARTAADVHDIPVTALAFAPYGGGADGASAKFDVASASADMKLALLSSAPRGLLGIVAGLPQWALRILFFLLFVVVSVPFMGGFYWLALDRAD